MASTKVTLDSGVEVMIPTILDVDQILTTHSKLKLISAQLGANTPIEGIYETAERELKHWCHQDVKTRGIPKGVIAVVALATAIVTQGMGAELLCLSGGLSATVANAGFSTLCSQIGTTLVATGDLGKAMESIAKRDNILSLAASIATAGALHEMGICAPTGSKVEFTDIATYATKETAVKSGVSVALGRAKLEDAIKQAGLDILLTTGNIYGAREIGKRYSPFNPDGTPKLDGPEINTVTHKVLHGLLGAAVGAVKGDAIAGAIGGMASETIMEIFKEDIDKVCAQVAQEAHQQGIKLGSDGHMQLVQTGIKKYTNWAKMGAAVATLLARRDVTISSDVAAIALEHNNALVLRLGVIALDKALEATLGISLAALIAKGGSDIIDRLREKDAAAAMMDAHPEDMRWVDEGLTVVDPEAQQLITLPPGLYPVLPGYEIFPASELYRQNEGFQAYIGPSSSVLLSEGHDTGKTKQIIRTPVSIQDKMALEAAKRGEGRKLIERLNDPKFKGMEKWEYKVKSELGKDSVVHYVKDPNTGQLMDFKFKKRSID